MNLSVVSFLFRAHSLLFSQNKKPQIVSKIPNGWCEVAAQIYSSIYLGALDFMYCLFILNNTLTLSVKVEEYAYIIYTFWFCQIISHFMLSERLTTQSSQ